MKIILHGYTGRMGKMVQQAAAGKEGYELAAMAAADSQHEAENCFVSLDEYSGDADVVIDFSNHSATGSLLEYCLKRKLPAVICTTGQTAEEKEMISRAAEEIPVFCSANMSVGIAVLADVVRRAVSMFPDADVEIVEIHHNQKLDAPSGTALILADAVKEVRPDAVYHTGRSGMAKREKNEIGIQSVRMGTETGTHQVYIHTGNECLTFTHQACSRAVFADGALAAADFIVGQEPGLYTMKEMLNKK